MRSAQCALTHNKRHKQQPDICGQRGCARLCQAVPRKRQLAVAAAAATATEEYYNFDSVAPADLLSERRHHPARACTTRLGGRKPKRHSTSRSLIRSILAAEMICKRNIVCAWLSQAVPDCPRLCKAVRGFARLCETARGCASNWTEVMNTFAARAELRELCELCEAVRSCARLCEAVRSCARLAEPG